MRQRVTMTMLAALMAVTVFAQGGPGQGGPGQGGPGQGPRPGQGGPGMMMGRAPMPFGLLLQRDVQTELKMTEVQIGQIQKLVAPGAPGGPQGGGQRGGFGGGQGQGGVGGGQRGQGQGGGQRGGFGQGQQGGPGGPGGFGMSPQERERLDREVAKILNATQNTRFQQLALQQQGPSAMLDAKVTAKLGLSPEQVDQIRKIMQENRPQMGGPGGQRGGQGQGGVGGGQRGQGGQGQGGVGGGQRGQGGQGQGGVGGGQRGQGGQGQDNFEEMRKQMEARREELNKKLLAVLTSNQRSTWNSMLGQPFKFQQPGFGGPGGPGGRGGRGSGGGGQ